MNIHHFLLNIPMKKVYLRMMYKKEFLTKKGGIVVNKTL